jgi:hypothetical protein
MLGYDQAMVEKNNKQDEKTQRDLTNEIYNVIFKSHKNKDKKVGLDLISSQVAGNH